MAGQSHCEDRLTVDRARVEGAAIRQHDLFGDVEAETEVSGYGPLALSSVKGLEDEREQIVSRQDILERAFGYDFHPGTNLVDVHVAHLRRQLERGGVAIETVRGVGFCLDGDDSTELGPTDDTHGVAASAALAFRSRR